MRQASLSWTKIANLCVFTLPADGDCPMFHPLRVIVVRSAAGRALLTLASAALAATSQLAAQEVRFNRDVLPILAENCFACHGFDAAKRQAGLRLDSAAGATAVLESGARAVVPGDVGQSALVDRIFNSDADVRMPPVSTGKQLTPEQKETLRRWVAQGSRYETHWAFLVPHPPEPPLVEGLEHPVDCFIRARLSREQIESLPEAGRAMLIRRLSLDLIGLPPAPLDVDAFVHDPRPDSYERVVDRLLGSEHFGERWARWWLDLAHYADSDGYLQDFIRPTAWRYRQWVVEAFNRDLPFDQFTIEQLAGDLLPGATISQRIATGFLRNTLSNREGGADLEEFRVRQVVDRTTTVATTWLALTLGCAECHDHKFDALTQREFYQLYAFFNNADEVNFNSPLPDERGSWERAQGEYLAQRADLLAPVAAQLAALQADWEQHLLYAEAHPDEDFTWDRALEVLGLGWGQGQGEGQLEGINIIKTPLAERTEEQRDRLLDYFLAHPPAIYVERFKELKANELRAKLDSLQKTLPPMTRAPGMMRAVRPRTTHVHIRGDFRRPGDEVLRNTPVVLPPLAPDTDADRLALAHWLVSPEHPLTARVTVNRLWQELFGRGIVATSENFGVRGERPSHPELLDWLATEFPKRGWSIKNMLRLIVTSRTYRQSSYASPELIARDPQNILLARQSRWRLSAEAVRDNALAVSGLLSRTVGGPSVKPPQPASVSKEGFRNEWVASRGADRYRRGLYTFLQRTSPFSQFVTFDLPDSSRSCTRRERSNTPLQALQLLNDPLFVEASRALASRILREAPPPDDFRLKHAFVLVLARAPEPAEAARLLAYLEQQKAIFQAEPQSAAELLSDPLPAAECARHAAWVAVASVLLNLDETVTRE